MFTERRFPCNAAVEHHTCKGEEGCPQTRCIRAPVSCRNRLFALGLGALAAFKALPVVPIGLGLPMLVERQTLAADSVAYFAEAAGNFNQGRIGCLG